MGKNNAKMIDPSVYLAAGVDPKTKKPLRLFETGLLKQIRAAFRIIDEQDAVNRYKWYNIPFELSSEEIERMLYYKGSLIAFVVDDKFYLTPYALSGTIDVYGRYNTVKPVPMSSGTEEDSAEEKRKREKDLDNISRLLSQLKLNVVKTPKDFEELKEEDLNNSAVILYDYTKQLSQTILPRFTLNEGFVNAESKIIPYMSTALLAGTGIKGLRVNDADAADETKRASAQIMESALNENLFVAMTAPVDFQELSDGSPLKSEEFLLALQSLDNIRKGTLGIENGGIFQKKAHKLESEQMGNESSVATVFQDGLSQRQHFCNIFNSIFGTNLWCMPGDAVLGQDVNLDGQAYDIDDGTAAGSDMGSEGGNDNGGDDI